MTYLEEIASIYSYKPEERATFPYLDDYIEKIGPDHGSTDPGGH